jgi:hypothetical protein
MVHHFLAALSLPQARSSVVPRHESRRIAIGLSGSVAAFQAILVYDSRHFAEAVILLDLVAEQSVVSLAALLVLFVEFVLVVVVRSSATDVCHSNAAVVENRRQQEVVAAVAKCSDPWSCHSILGGDSVADVDDAFGPCRNVLHCS